MTEHTDHILPFQLEKHAIIGRSVRLTHVARDIMSRHDYPHSVGQLLGETLALVAMLGSLLKIKGRFSVQIKGNGPISTLLADYHSEGNLRGLARYDVNYFTNGELIEADAIPMLLGDGHVIMNIEQENQPVHQTIVPIADGMLADIARDYFRRTAQLVSDVRLVAETDENQEWSVGGILIQEVPADTALESAPNIANDDWRRLRLLLETAADDELLDPALPQPTLAYRLFHEDGVRIFEPRPLNFSCTCTEISVLNMLHSLPENERDDLAYETKIEVRCEFCNQVYLFDPDIIHANKAH